MTDVVIVTAKRSPVGSFNGSLSLLGAHEISTQVIKEVLKSAGLQETEITNNTWSSFNYCPGTKPSPSSSHMRRFTN